MNNLLETTETTVVTQKIVSYKIETLEKKMASFAKRAAKLNVAPLTLKILGTEIVEIIAGIDVEGNSIVRKVEYTTVEITGETPKIAGYTFAATVETVEGTDSNIIHRIPGCELEAPVCYRTSGKICEHCNKRRNRTDTYLVRNDYTEEWSQVGKTCLVDFLGEDVSAFLSRLSWWDTLALFSEEEVDFGKVETIYARSTFLAAVAYFIRTAGWISRSKAHESVMPLDATADDALWLLSPSFTNDERESKDKHREKMTSADSAVAVSTLSWVREGWGAEDVNLRKEYEHNCVVALEAGDAYDVVTQRGAGLVASTVFCYLRAVKRLAEAKADAAGSLNEHFGKVGGGDEAGVFKSGKRKGETKFTKGYSLTLTIVSIFEKIDEYGEYPTTFIHKMRDGDGRTFTWFGSRHIEIDETGDGTYYCAVGDTFTATFALKAHKEFKGKLETIVNRPRKETLVSKQDA